MSRFGIQYKKKDSEKWKLSSVTYSNSMLALKTFDDLIRQYKDTEFKVVKLNKEGKIANIIKETY